MKNSDGKKGTKQLDKEQKLSKELNKITKIIDRRKRDRGGEEEFLPMEKKRSSRV